MKKTLAIILAMALLCIMAVGTTLSYFTDEDFDQNTMTVGKVEIEQIEQKRNENGALVNLAADDDGVTSLGRLYPYTGRAAVEGWFSTANNAVDKIVTVKNTGSEAAYVRTVFAFEMMKKVTKGANDEDIITWENPIADEIVLNHNGINMTTVEIVKEDTHYIVGYYIYNDVLAANTTTTTPSLKQVYLDSEVGNDFSDAIGGEYEILVLSQAVQTQGFAEAGGKTAAEVALDTAFGAITAENATEIAKWFN